MPRACMEYQAIGRNSDTRYSTGAQRQRILLQLTLVRIHIMLAFFQLCPQERWSIVNLQVYASRSPLRIAARDQTEFCRKGTRQSAAELRELFAELERLRREA